MTAVLGAVAAPRDEDERLEELVYRTAAAALRFAGLSRDDVDSVTLAASDERDGRSISSMLTAAPAGGLGKEVTKVTDGSLHALALAAAKILAGCSEVGLIVSWDIASEADVDAVATSALEPFVERPTGVIDPIATALLAAQYFARTGADSAALDVRAWRKAQAVGAAAGGADWVSWPLRHSHLAPERDGAAAVVIASPDFVSARGLRPVADIEGMGWATDTYSLGERAWPLGATLRTATDEALARAGATLADLDNFELDDANVFAECIAAEGVGLAPEGGGLALLTGSDPLRRRAEDGFAGVPPTCSGLWRLAQVCAAAPGRSLIHQAVGRAAQGHAVAVVRSEGPA
jgi:acetyl-CoA acetyltransferase